MNKIPKFKSIKEEAEFWDTHSVADYLDEFKRVENPYTPKRELKGSLTIRMAPSVKRAVETRARRYDISPSTLVRMWVADRLIESEV